MAEAKSGGGGEGGAGAKAAAHPGLPPKAPTLGIGEEREFPHSSSLSCGLAWDYYKSATGAVDLDASCVAFDSRGRYFETCYFADLEPDKLNGAVKHCGDSRDGLEEGDDEVIDVDLSRLPDEVCALFFVVTSYAGDKFLTVETAVVHLYDGDKHPFVEYQLALTSRSANGLIMCRVHRTSPGAPWIVKAVGMPCEGRCFHELIPFCQEELIDIIPNVEITPLEKFVILTKGETSDLPNTNSIWVGLGWDMIGAEDAADLDASLAAFDQEGQLIDMVFFNRLQCMRGLIEHTGDNRTGEGAGDDERIYVDISRLPGKVRAFCVCVTSYEDHNFNNIANAYVRVLRCDSAKEKQTEALRFPLTHMGDRTALIMCTIYRGDEEKWRMKAEGLSFLGKTIQDALPLMTDCVARLRLPQPSQHEIMHHSNYLTDIRDEMQVRKAYRGDSMDGGGGDGGGGGSSGGDAAGKQGESVGGGGGGCCVIS